MKKISSKKRDVILGLLILFGLLIIFSFHPTPSSNDTKWGVNFSILHARALHEDWREMYIDILDELEPKVVRTMAYWSLIEPTRGDFDFSDIDWLLTESSIRDVEVILVLGPKQPRWPECHEPSWYRELSDEQQVDAVNEMLNQAVMHFRDFKNIKAWQIENEAFFPFAEECSVLPWKQVKAEVELIKQLDDRPVVLTDSGEWGLWLPSGWAGADILGSTMYRTVYHNDDQRYSTLRIPPLVYTIRAKVVTLLTGVKKVIGIELQAEPWFITDVLSTPVEAQLELMNPKIFAEHVAYAKRVGFVENYFWGVEWWYWMREQGEPQMWITAKEALK